MPDHPQTPVEKEPAPRAQPERRENARISFRQQLPQSSLEVSIVIGLTRRGLTAQAVRYLLFGEGETGLMIYTILLRYWDWTLERRMYVRSSS